MSQLHAESFRDSFPADSRERECMNLFIPKTAIEKSRFAREG